jgi:hypothetical protein
MPFSAVAHTPKVLASGKLPRWDQKISALSVLYRLRLWRLADSWRLVLANKGD